jgi:hypothetical protein
MIKLCDVASVAFGLACRGAVLLLGVGLFLGMSSAPDPGPPRDGREPGRGAGLGRDEDGKTCITLGVP